MIIKVSFLIFVVPKPRSFTSGRDSLSGVLVLLTKLPGYLLQGFVYTVEGGARTAPYGGIYQKVKGQFTQSPKQTGVNSRHLANYTCLIRTDYCLINGLKSLKTFCKVNCLHVNQECMYNDEEHK